MEGLRICEQIVLCFGLGRGFYLVHWSTGRDKRLTHDHFWICVVFVSYRAPKH